MGKLRTGKVPTWNNLGRVKPMNNMDSAFKYLKSSRVEQGIDQTSIKLQETELRLMTGYYKEEAFKKKKTLDQHQ